MTTVQAAQKTLDAITSKKNAADSRLVDVLAREKDLSGRIARMAADGPPSDPEVAAQFAKDLAAARVDRAQARQDVEDLEGASEHLAADIVTARQAVHQAAQCDARAVMRAANTALSAAADGLEQTIQAAVKYKKAAIDAGSKLRAAGATLNISQSFGVELLVENTLRDRIFGERGGLYMQPVRDVLAVVLLDTAHHGKEPV
jgi:hypothetical protein